MKCSYGCGNKGIYKFKNSNICCENYFTKCPAVREKNSKNQIGKIISNETKRKQSRSQKNRYTKELKKVYSERMIEKYKDNNEREKQKEIAKKIWLNKEFREKHKTNVNNYHKNNSKFTIEQLSRKYPIFSKVEELRYRLNTKKIQVRCKKCNRWFTPTSQQLYDRINQIENLDGNDGCFLYCSETCKENCSLYNLKSDPNKSINKPYTKSEYDTFKKFVLERDHHICQFCEEQAIDVHHERPQKLEPFFALDPDFAWSCCEDCHYKKGHPTGTECSTGGIANIKC